MRPEEAEARFGTSEALSPTSYKKASVVIHYQHEALLKDLLEVCVFIKFIPEVLTLETFFSLYSLATGIEVDEQSMMTAAERVYNVERAFLVRMGITRKDDVLVGKWATEPVPNGPFKGEILDPDKWEGMLDEYYQLRGWDENGIPTPEKLKELGLEDVIEKIPQGDPSR
jgi:aldehyde:ferredoxin oxidoreductase